MKIIYPAYGALGFALSVVGIPLFMYLPTFYASDVGINIATVGIILLVARSLDMLLDPLIGHISDHFGKRKPFMLAGSFALLIGYYFLIHPSFFPEVWLFVFSMIVYIGWSLISIPYMALSSEISSDYHEKTTLSSWREAMAIAGMISALLIPYGLNISDQHDATLESLYTLLLLSLPIALLLLLWKVPEIKNPIQTTPFIQGIKTIFKSNAAVLVGAYFPKNGCKKFHYLPQILRKRCKHFLNKSSTPCRPHPSMSSNTAAEMKYFWNLSHLHQTLMMLPLMV